MGRGWGTTVAVFFAVLLVGGACRLLLPERYAVNAPLGFLVFGQGRETPEDREISERIRPPDGFRLNVFAKGIPNARILRLTDAGDLLVSSPRSGRVYLLERDDDADGRSDGIRELLTDLELPHGIDLQQGWLYVAETGAVRRIRFDAARRQTQGDLETVVDGIPAGGNHFTRTLRFGPDDAMYLSVGSSCNVCEERDPRRAAILRFGPDGSGEEIFASGLRNAVGFDWKPDTGELFATDNGRDLLGDDFPPCELNHVVSGGFYGWPYANGRRVIDPDQGTGHEAEVARSRVPSYAFGAHTAPLGIAFLRNAKLPAWRGAALVALHGSWNRTSKSGYKVVSLHWSPDGRIEERDFIVGFELDEDVIGRPVDVVESADGTIYISDDYASAVYRVVAKSGENER